MKRSLVILPLGLPLAWPADYELQTARALAKHHIVLLLAITEGMSLRALLVRPQPLLSRLAPNVFVFRPLYIIPFQRVAPVRTVNTLLAVLQVHLLLRITRAWRALPKIFWTFSLQYTIFPDHFKNVRLAVYDCVDAFVASDTALREQWKKHEQRILAGSNIVFTNQRALYKRMQPKHPAVFQAPIGYNARLGTAGKNKEPADLARIAHPRISTIGTINRRIDIAFLREVARRLPAYSFVLIGAIDPHFDGGEGRTFLDELATLRALPNVFLLGNKSKRQIASYYAHSDVGFIPYNVRLAFNRFCFPMKTLEYFGAGTPVVTTPIPSLLPLAPLVTIAPSPAAAASAIQHHALTPWPQDNQRKQRSVATANSWDKKIAAMMRMLAAEFPDHFVLK